MPKPKHQRFPLTPFFLLTALGMLLYTNAEAQQTPTAGSPPPPLQPQTDAISNPPADPATCENPVDVPFAGVFVATYTTAKDNKEVDNIINNIEINLTELMAANANVFHLKIGNSADNKISINTNHNNDDLLLKIAYKSPCKESCEERNKRIKELDPAKIDSQKMSYADIEAYLTSNFGDVCINALKSSDCKQGYNEKCLSEIQEQCGPCQTRQEALRNLVYRKISKSTKKGQPFLLISIYFKANERGQYPYVIQRFWPKIEQEEKPPIISEVLYTKGCSGNPDKCCWVRLLNQAITEAKKLQPPRKVAAAPPEKPTGVVTTSNSTTGAGTTSNATTGSGTTSNSTTKTGTEADTAAQPAQPVGATGKPSLCSQRSPAMKIALATLGVGLAGSALATATLAGINWGPNKLDLIEFVPRCGTRMDMSCGSFRPKLDVEVGMLVGFTVLFGVGVAATAGIEHRHWKSLATQASDKPTAPAPGPAAGPTTSGPTTPISGPTAPAPSRAAVTPTIPPAAALKPASPPQTAVDSVRKASPQPSSTPVL